MNPREEIKRLWRESFDDSEEFVDMFFSRVYSDDDALTLSRADGALCSALLLQRYDMAFHATRQGMAYICGAATRKSQRGKGYMSVLLREALREAESRGDTFCSLIPAHSWLYPFYARFGFASVFLVNADRYTALHPFNIAGEYIVVDNLYDPAVYEAFGRLETTVPCRVLHSRRDFLNALDDNRISGGAVAVMADPAEGGRLVSMAWGVESDGMLRVTDLLGETPDASCAALRQLRASFADLPVTVAALPDDSDRDSLSHRRTLTPTGMSRIVSVRRCLEAIVVSHPRWRCRIRVTDPLIEANNCVFAVSEGKVAEDKAENAAGLDFDVDVDVLTRLVFSAPSVGEITGMPSVRPQMSLMLD